jgi:hypothetical protein
METLLGLGYECVLTHVARSASLSLVARFQNGEPRCCQFPPRRAEWGALFPPPAMACLFHHALLLVGDCCLAVAHAVSRLCRTQRCG